MKLFARFIDQNIVRTRWSSANLTEEGWCEIEKEPNLLAGEYLSFDSDLKIIVIRKREKSVAEIIMEEKAKKEAESFTPAVVADLVRRVGALERRG
jgi:hypothetical protein